MRGTPLFALAVAAGLFSAGAADAARIEVLGAVEDPYWRYALIRIEGEIESGDAERFGSAVEGAGLVSTRGEKILVELNSDGGSYVDGLALAAEFRRRGAATIVRAGDGCYSACALAFLGGAEPLKNPYAEPTGIPDQMPDRSIEPGAFLGFHAPYLLPPDASYDAEDVGDAYRMAIDGIAMLIRLSEHLYVEQEELPRLLEPDRDAMLMADTVDAVRSLWIDYTDRSLQFRDLGAITRPMVENACINRWHHLRRRSALPGYAEAARVAADFEEGAALLDNGEAGLSFGVWRSSSSSGPPWIAFMPVAMTEDGREYVWCIFTPGSFDADVLYRRAGTVSDLLEPLGEPGGRLALRVADGVVTPDAGQSITFGGLRPMDLVPAATPLDQVAERLRDYQDAGSDLGQAVD